MSWLDVLATAGGVGLQHYANNKSIKKQNRILASAQQEQSALAQQRMDEIFKNTTAYQPQNAQAALDGAVQPIQQNLEGVAKQAAAESQRALPSNASADFQAGAAERNESEMVRAMREAALQARAQGAGRVQMSQQMANNQSTSNQNDIAAIMQATARNRENDLRRARFIDPRLMLGAAALGAVPEYTAGRRRNQIPQALYAGSPQFYANGGWGSGNAYGNRDLGENF